MMTKKQLEELLVVGAKIRFGKRYAKEHFEVAGTVVELVQGQFEIDRSDFTVTEYAPSVWNEQQKDYDSIYHLFGNDLEDFKDCEILNSIQNEQ